MFEWDVQTSSRGWSHTTCYRLSGQRLPGICCIRNYPRPLVAPCAHRSLLPHTSNLCVQDRYTLLNARKLENVNKQPQQRGSTCFPAGTLQVAVVTCVMAPSEARRRSGGIAHPQNNS